MFLTVPVPAASVPIRSTLAVVAQSNTPRS
jgi:hypothetical protein